VAEPGTLVVGTHWHEPNELAYVTRCVAAAASRCGPVVVLAPGASGPDGAFDLSSLDTGRCDPAALPRRCTVFVDDDTTPAVEALIDGTEPRAVYRLSGEPRRDDWRPVILTGDGTGDAPGGTRLTVHVPVHPLAARERHHGFGFTGYQLVLSDRRDASRDDPPDAARWLTAAFPDDHVVVVEDGTAAAWRGRALRGVVSVDTRMDLWRLVAHACVCVDLGPGHQIARECIESLRYGTPIVVPADSGPAARHARAAGGSTFENPSGLIDAVGALRAPPAALSAAGQRYADEHYGDSSTLVAQVRAIVTDGDPAPQGP
jgi:hypothetical protein